MPDRKATGKVTLSAVTTQVSTYVSDLMVASGLDPGWIKQQPTRPDGIVTFGCAIASPAALALGEHALHVVPVADRRVIVLCMEEGCNCRVLDGPMAPGEAVARLRDAEDDAVREARKREVVEFGRMVRDGIREYVAGRRRA
jgi:hypothetical protein